MALIDPAEVLGLACEDFGEATEYSVPATRTLPTRLEGVIWGAVELADLGNGFVADRCSVLVQVADLVGPRNERLVPEDNGRGIFRRYPDEVVGFEDWSTVPGGVRREGAAWVCELERNVRPVGR